MSEEHPAMVAARNSWRCVQAKAKEEWLSLMADDICIEDPIGVSPLDPTGKGHSGKEAVGAFWEQNIAPNSIAIEPHRSFAAGKESAHHMTLTTTFPNGAKTIVTGIFTYRVDDEGKLSNLRGFWELGQIRVEQPA